MVNCFALRKGKCRVLNVNKCEGISCSFYKTVEEEREGRKGAFKRIKTLDKPTQMHICETYYGGEMPWLKGGDR